MSSCESKLHIDVESEAVCRREHDTEVKMVVLLSHSNIVQALERIEQDKTAMLVRLDRLTGVDDLLDFSWDQLWQLSDEGRLGNTSTRGFDCR